jgi:hypothetical protein
MKKAAFKCVTVCFIFQVPFHLFTNLVSMFYLRIL